MKILIKKLKADAKTPVFAKEGDAGMDLYSAQGVILKPGQRIFCKTNIAIKIPDGYAGLVWDKSGPSHKFGIKTLGGVFDSNYTGEYLVGLVNLGQEDFEIKKGQRIAQLPIQKVEVPKIEEVGNLPQTNRGTGGFGSTGLL